MLSKFEYDRGLNPHFSPGDFRLEIASIAAYCDRVGPQIILIDSTASEKLPHIQQQFQTQGLTCTAVQYPHLTTDDSDRPLTLTAQADADAAVSAKEIAKVVVQALDQPQACNTTVAIAPVPDSQTSLQQQNLFAAQHSS
jgi:hypothetical protein